MKGPPGSRERSLPAELAAPETAEPAHSLASETVAGAACRSVSLRPTTRGARKFQKKTNSADSAVSEGLADGARIGPGTLVGSDCRASQREPQAALLHLHFAHSARALGNVGPK